MKPPQFPGAVGPGGACLTRPLRVITCYPLWSWSSPSSLRMVVRVEGHRPGPPALTLSRLRGGCGRPVQGTQLRRLGARRCPRPFPLLACHHVWYVSVRASVLGTTEIFELLSLMQQGAESFCVTVVPASLETWPL